MKTLRECIRCSCHFCIEKCKQCGTTICAKSGMKGCLKFELKE